VSDIIVETARRVLRHEGRELPCLIGKGGTIAADAKREGDGATPLGRWPVGTVLLRRDRVNAPAGLRLPWRWLRPDDGWSDGVDDPAYNRPIHHPHGYSAERLWRADGAYDVIVTLAHNDAPPIPGAGSAIFFHCTAERDFTEGCVAIDRSDMLEIVAKLSPGDAIDLR
jgi:L,D-peptidoglycan transpeptidase YkuD (ErfK/YbiS/YcfS/YnhG family)